MGFFSKTEQTKQDSLVQTIQSVATDDPLTSDPGPNLVGIIDRFDVEDEGELVTITGLVQITEISDSDEGKENGETRDIHSIPE